MCVVSLYSCSLLCSVASQYVVLWESLPPVNWRQLTANGALLLTLEVYSSNASVGLAVSPAFTSDKTILMPNQFESASHCLFSKNKKAELYTHF